MPPAANEATVREFVRCFNEGDIDGLVLTLDSEIELNSMKGPLKGVPAARRWATRAPGGVQQNVVIEGVESDGDRVLLSIRRDWHWEEEGTLAASDEMAWLFQLTDQGQVISWKPFAERSEAVAAFSQA